MSGQSATSCRNSRYIHVIGRRTDDPWWPQAAWGQPSTARYARERVDALRASLLDALGSIFSPSL
jgi:hypothetical protein